ncbi:dna polymerase epsilon subunit b protein [Cystoisospora suis]|uniref:Dna polymerase epsilon subunit b protein n=1 Tax=Cystoisospora suis TaxID=483139 RepID=A0A2C6L1L7_9APIC|nr:dna polymerase epsilon subunit b protein [Cystoisospora suis]
MGHSGDCPTACTDGRVFSPCDVAPTLLEHLCEDADFTLEDLKQLREGLSHYSCMHSNNNSAGNAKRVRGPEEDICTKDGGDDSSSKRTLRAMPSGCLRAVADYEDKSSRFVIQTRKYQQQYSAVYFARLATLKSTLLGEAKRRWPGIPVHACIRDVQTWQECAVAGTLYKDMILKPSVLKEYLDDLELQTRPNTFLSDTDSLFLEDQTARVRLVTTGPPSGGPGGTSRQSSGRELRVNSVVTGLLIAVRGVSSDNGRFEVRDFCLCGAPAFPRLAPVAPRLPLEAAGRNGLERADLNSKFVAFVSDLRVGDPRTNSTHLQLLRDFILGAFGGITERSLASRIVRLIVAGNALSAAQSSSPSGSTGLPASSSSSPLASSSAVTSNASSALSLKTMLQEADVYFSQFASSIPVDLMPGPDDPTTYALPQRPLHSALLPCSRAYASMHGVPNPHSFVLDQIRFIGSSGQAVRNICAFSDLSPLGALRLCAEGRCLAPTAPDSLSFYPFVKDDPFCISTDEDFQHVYFSACHDALSFERMPAGSVRKSDSGCEGETECEGMKVEEERADGPLLLCVPSFAKTSTLVLVDLQTLSVHPIHLAVTPGENV